MPQIRNFADVHKVLDQYVSRNTAPGSYSLESVKELMDKLGNPQDTYKVVHVAGTSGKTSTCYYMAALLQQAGQKVGLTVSPHIDEVNERVQVGLVPMPEKEFCSELEKFVEIIDKTGIELSYFELLVAFAYWEFAEQKVDYAVVEVGLGGLVDGTNIINRSDKICVITDIGLDHTKILGKTISEISAQKAGIIQDHNRVFAYHQSSEVMGQIVARCTEQHAVLHEVVPEVAQENDIAPFKRRDFYLAKNVFDFIARNENWPTPSSEILHNILHVNIPARMEEFKMDGKTLIIDGSHNSQKMRALVQGIKIMHPDQKIAALVSFVKSEDKRAALGELRRLDASVIATTFTGGQDSPKTSIGADEIEKIFSEAGFEHIKIIPDPRVAYDELLKQPEPILLVTGSFYLLNHIRPLIKT